MVCNDIDKGTRNRNFFVNLFDGLIGSLTLSLSNKHDEVKLEMVMMKIRINLITVISFKLKVYILDNRVIKKVAWSFKAFIAFFFF